MYDSVENLQSICRKKRRNILYNKKRYEKASIIIKINIVFSKFQEVFGNQALTNTLLDYLLYYCSVLDINGSSYRIKNQLQLISDKD